MTLRLISHRVQSVALGAETRYEGATRTLTVSTEDAEAAFRYPALAGVRVSWASPGDSVRIVKVLDAVEPRTNSFPGFLGPAKPLGSGDLHVVEGVAVLAAGYVPRAQEGMIEMTGPGAELSPFGSLHNLVIEFAPAEPANWEAVDAALRLGLLRLASRIAAVTVESPPDEIRSFSPFVVSKHGDLPRIGAITNLQTQGAFKDVFVYGRSLAGALPTVMDPNEVETGAVVSGQFGHPALKNPTFVHQNNPVVRELRSRDGTDLTFAGLVLAPEPVEQAAKELISAHAARLCAALGMDGVVITKEGGGNADADIALKMDALHDLGIETVGLFAEMAGPDGTAPPLVVPPDRATGMVSLANYDEVVALPAVDRALGGERLDVLDAPATAAVEAPMAVIYCSLSPLGAGRLMAQPVGGAPSVTAQPGTSPRGQPGEAAVPA